MAEGRLQEALQSLNRLAAGGYTTSELFEARARVNLALGNADDAERDWRRAASLDPASMAPRLSLGSLYLQRALWPEAIKVYREVLLYQPRNVEATLGLVDALQKSGRTVGARKLLEAAAAAISDQRLQERWAQVAAESGRPTEAERALNQVAGRLTGRAKRDVLRKLAALYLSQGRMSEAFPVLREALALEDAAGGITEETYDLAVRPADRLVEQALGGVRRAVRDLDEGASYREDAFEAVQASRQELAGLERFVSEIKAPETRRVAHAARAYAYSLVNEAAVNALTYVDIGLKANREVFFSAQSAARSEMDRLAKTAERPERRDR